MDDRTPTLARDEAGLALSGLPAFSRRDDHCLVADRLCGMALLQQARGQ